MDGHGILLFKSHLSDRATEGRRDGELWYSGIQGRGQPEAIVLIEGRMPEVDTGACGKAEHVTKRAGAVRENCLTQPTRPAPTRWLLARMAGRGQDVGIRIVRPVGSVRSIQGIAVSASPVRAGCQTSGLEWHWRNRPVCKVRQSGWPPWPYRENFRLPPSGCVKRKGH